MSQVMQWRPIETLPEFDKCPQRLFILVEGFKEHGDNLWSRTWADVARICRPERQDSILGFRGEDMERIRRDGDMDCVERVTHWAPAVFPAFPAPESPSPALSDLETELLGALKAVSAIIVDGAMTGFRCDDGDWAERLFFSQQATSRAIKRAEGRS